MLLIFKPNLTLQPWGHLPNFKKHKSLMCLITNQSKPTILTEDMIVYKILKVETRYKLVSLSENFTLGLNKLYYTEIKQGDAYFFDTIAELAIASTIKKKDNSKWRRFLVNRSRKELRQFDLYSYGQGFHSCKTFKRAHDLLSKHSISSTVIVQCKIPAGSEIYEDLSGLIVSNQIIIL